MVTSWGRCWHVSPLSKREEEGWEKLEAQLAAFIRLKRSASREVLVECGRRLRAWKESCKEDTAIVSRCKELLREIQRHSVEWSRREGDEMVERHFQRETKKMRKHSQG